MIDHDQIVPTQPVAIDFPDQPANTPVTRWLFECEGLRPLVCERQIARNVTVSAIFAGRLARREYGPDAEVLSCRPTIWNAGATIVTYEAMIARTVGRFTGGKLIRFTVTMTALQD